MVLQRRPAAILDPQNGEGARSGGFFVKSGKDIIEQRVEREVAKQTRRNNQNDTMRSEIVPYGLKLSLVVVLLSVSGLISTYLYFSLIEAGGEFVPGLLYTAATILVFWLTGTDYKRSTLWKYCGLMVLAYLAVWFVTLVSSWFVWIGGPITAGLGAILTLLITNKYIVPIRFSRMVAFLSGASAFVLVLIAYAYTGDRFDKTPLEYLFLIDVELNQLFCELFLFWHLIVGTHLFLLLSKAKRHAINS